MHAFIHSLTECSRLLNADLQLRVIPAPAPGYIINGSIHLISSLLFSQCLERLAPRSRLSLARNAISSSRVHDIVLIGPPMQRSTQECFFFMTFIPSPRGGNYKLLGRSFGLSAVLLRS